MKTAWRNIASLAVLCVVAVAPAVAWAGPTLRLDLGEGGPTQVDTALKMVATLTAIALAPALLLSMTSFVRIVVVFSFLRQALGLQSTPPTPVLTGLALFITAAIMGPVAGELYGEGIAPYLDGKLPAAEAMARGSAPLRAFMLRQTRDADLALFYEINREAPPSSADAVSMPLLIPAFIISELRTGFEMGFMLFVPFILVDLIIGSLLMALGFVMLPPAMISLPIKILLFVLADGWNLLVGSLVRSFA